MLLQEIKDGVLNIYELSADDEELINYRKELGVGRERIRQIEAKALRKMRQPSRAYSIKGYLNNYEVIDAAVGQTLYNTENNSYYSESIYDDNYDYQSPPKR